MCALFFAVTSRTLSITEEISGMKQIQIAQHIDEPPHFLLWAVDEMVPPVLGIVAGILLGQMFYCLSAGLVVNHFYKRFRDHRPNGYLLHMLNWYIGVPLKGFCFRHVFIREFW